MICYCLGYTSHVDWSMTMIGLEWCKKGYIFFMNDHYGHGSSDGLWTFIPNFNIIVDDAYYVFEYAKKIYTPSIIKDANKRFNYFLLGQSMGANVALQIALKYQNKIKKYRSSHYRRKSITNLQNHDNEHFEYDPNDYIQYLPPMIQYPYNGMLFLSPMIKISEETKPGTLVEFIFKHFLLNLVPSAPIIPSTSNLGYSTRDLKKLEFMRKDPLDWNLNPRVATGWNLLNACNFIEKQLNKIYLPFIVLHGTDDKVTDHTMSDALYERTGTHERNKSIRKYEDAYHHLFMEFCRDEAYDDLDDWMERHSNNVDINLDNTKRLEMVDENYDEEQKKEE